MPDLFPGRNSMVLWKGKKIQIQTQMHMDNDPPEIGTVVIKDGQVIKRKTTEVGDFLNEPNGQKKVNEMLQKQHSDIVQAIEDKKKQRITEERRVKEAMEKEKQANEATEPTKEDKKSSSGFKSMLSGLFGKKKKG